MSEPFDYHAVSQTPVGWAFIEALSGLGLKHEFFDSIKPGEPVQVELKFNGFEVSFTRIIEMLMANFDRAVAESAEEMLNDKAADVLTSLSDLKAEVARHAGRLFPDSVNT